MNGLSMWLFRAFVILSCPAIVYFQITPKPSGVLIGLAVGAVIVAVEFFVAQISLMTIAMVVAGTVLGMATSKFIDYPISQMGNDKLNVIWDKYSALRYFAFALLGMIIMVRKLPEFDDLDKDLLKMAKRRGADLKVLDISAIIDGRVVDIAETKFLSGALVVPRFVRQELHHLADSQDPLKRARGRRGLDILTRLQENPEVQIRMPDNDIPEINEIEAKVVRLAKQLGAKLITTDFNLMKICSIEGVTCLNVNDLGTALKPVVLPGEAMVLFVMKEGKERDQGVGYLDDGTMVVIEEGRRFIGKRVEASVSSILQTSAGRMIFAKAKGEKVG